MTTKRLHATISGRVQGVGFRWFTAGEAKPLGLSGWVRNRSDGTVEVLAEGDATAMEAFVRALERGPAGSRVEAIDADWSEGTGDLDPFTIRH